MDTSRTRFYFAITVLVAIAIGMLFFIHRPTPSSTPIQNGSEATTTGAIASTTAIATGTNTLTIGASSSVHAPNVNAPLVFSTSLSTQAQASVKKSFAAAQAAIAQNPLDLESWIALGVARKQAGDYQGAILDWQYVSAMAPENVVSFHNLGDLYQNYLHEYAKAVVAYKQAIVNNQKDLDAYKALFAIYTSNAYKAPASAAEAILKEGIASNPKAYDLQVLLARYYRAQGQNAQAKAQYDAAIANTQAQGQTNLADELKAEEGRL